MIFERVNIERIGEEWKERKNRGRQRERSCWKLSCVLNIERKNEEERKRVERRGGN